MPPLDRSRAYPEAERRILTNCPINGKAAPVQSILEGTGPAHGYFRYPISTRGARILAALRAEISTWKPDIVIYLPGQRGLLSSIRDALFFEACGIPKLTGFPV